jgi:hypothetical protein
MGVEGVKVHATGIETYSIKTKFTSKNSPNLEKDMSIQVQQAVRTPNRQDQNRTFSHLIILKH